MKPPRRREAGCPEAVHSTLSLPHPPLGSPKVTTAGLAGTVVHQKPALQMLLHRPLYRHLPKAKEDSWKVFWPPAAS
jgi:hypothetical protein